MALIVALAVALLATPVAARVALRLGVVDHPGPLKVHTDPVPYLGGVAVFLAVTGPVLGGHPALLLPLGLAVLLGLADDIADLAPARRLIGELVIGISAAAVVDARGPLGGLFTVAVVVVLLNAVNLLDGLDGLASGVSLLAAAGFAVVLDGDARRLALALAGALLGLLVWNRPPARIYLGDAGSYLVGTALALLLAGSFGAGQRVSVAGGAALFVAVPVADTAVAIVRRLRAGRPLFQGDRGHVYDQLVDRGWAPLAATGLCVAAQGALAACGIGIAALPAPAAVLGAGGLVVLVGVPLLWACTSPASWSN